MSPTKLLIVEDEAIVAENLSLKLAQLGYEVAGIAADGEEAVEMALRLKPRLILMDINLQGRLDGIEAAEEIRCREDLPVVYLTAHSDPATLARAKLSGPFGYILKPFETRDLATQIELALHKHQAEQQLREQREWLRVTLASIGDAVIATDAQGRIIFLNPVAESLTGWPGDEAAGKPLGDVFRIINEFTRATVSDPVKKVLQSGRIVGLANHTLLVRRDGKEVPIDDSGAPIRDREGHIQGTVLVFRDITERRQAEKAISESEQRLRLFIEQAPAALAMFDRRMGYLSVSRRWLSDYNLAGSDLIGRSYYEVFPEIPEHWRTVHRRALEGETLEMESERFERADGTVQWLHWEVKPWYDLTDSIGGVVIFSEDITDRKQTEAEREKLQEQLIQARKMESVGRLAGGVAHDFNNMLGIIIGHAELAMEQMGPASPIQADLQEIQTAAQRSANLTRQLLAFARRQAVLPEVIDLNLKINEMIRMLRRLIGEDIDLSWKPGEDLWPVEMDPVQADQLLANLCLNARDAIGGVGQITIETKNVVIDEGYSRLHVGLEPGRYVRLAVSDDGCGMDKEMLDNLFEPFYTTKGVGQGTGLGLSTVYGIVKQNHGSVEVYSEPGQGATFKIYLPRVMDQVGEKGDQDLESLKRGHETILLVEDEGAILHLAKTVLERLGYKVLAFQSPARALALVDEDKIPIDLLVTDVVMPEMNGRQLKERIKRRRPDLKVLFMSGYTPDAVAHRGILESEVPFLQKPFSNRSLAQKVREVLDREE